MLVWLSHDVCQEHMYHLPAQTLIHGCEHMTHRHKGTQRCTEKHTQGHTWIHIHRNTQRHTGTHTETRTWINAHEHTGTHKWIHTQGHTQRHMHRKGETENERWRERWDRGEGERREAEVEAEREALPPTVHVLGTLLGRVLWFRSQLSVSNVGGFTYCPVLCVLI